MNAVNLTSLDFYMQYEIKTKKAQCNRTYQEMAEKNSFRSSLNQHTIDWNTEEKTET